MQKKDFGVNQAGEMCYLYTIKNKTGLCATISDLGATLVSLEFLGKDLVLGFDKAIDYQADHAPYFGATVGRHANRISGAYILLNDQKYILDKNEGENNLHSGPLSYAFRKWELSEHNENSISFRLFSPHLDQGFPGNMQIALTYHLLEDNELLISYKAEADQDTICNLTNHSYFNLNGHDQASVLNHVLSLDADYYTEIDEQSIPTGKLVDVTGTVFDFRKPKMLKDGLAIHADVFKNTRGYDHNFVFANQGEFKKLASIYSASTGIKMDVFSDLPGIQIYTGNYLDGVRGKNGSIYNRHQGLCFETQYYPDALKHPHWPSPILKAFTSWQRKTSYKFSLCHSLST